MFRSIMGNIISANKHVLLDHMIVILYTITVSFILMINYYTNTTFIVMINKQ